MDGWYTLVAHATCQQTILEKVIRGQNDTESRVDARRNWSTPLISIFIIKGRTDKIAISGA